MSMRLAGIIGGAVLCVIPALALAQEPAPVTAETVTHEPTRLYFGMWTVHLKHDTVALKNNWLIGVAYRRFFGATFMNSFGRRAYAAGYQRTALTSRRGPLTASLGFRLGAISGYDGRFMRIARSTPVLPLMSVFGNVDVGRLGVELSYTIVIVSAAVSYRFGG